jgi:hypothetical protein
MLEKLSSLLITGYDRYNAQVIFGRFIRTSNSNTVEIVKNASAI